MGGIQFHLRQGEPLAVQSKGGIHRNDLPLGSVIGVELQMKGNFYKIIRLLKFGHLCGRRVRLRRSPGRLVVKTKAHVKRRRDVTLHKFQLDLLELAAGQLCAAGRSRPAVELIKAVVVIHIQALFLRKLSRVEDIHLLAVHNDVFHSDSNAALSLCLPDGLYILVLYGSRERG